MSDLLNYEPDPDPEDDSDSSAALPPDPHWRTYSAHLIFEADMPEIKWLCRDLDIGSGRPCGLWGAPGAGKNVTAQALALAVASGRPAFGRYPVNRGRVIHISYDLGIGAVSLLYRQLANGMGLDVDHVWDRLEVCAHPTPKLTDPKARHVFAKRLKGFDLAILDNARQAAPGVDENDSDFGGYLAAFGAAADDCRCVALYLHHLRKNSDGSAPSIDSGRGSGAITAASGTIWAVDGAGSDPRRLTQLRTHDTSRDFKAPLWLTLERPTAGRFLFDTEDYPPALRPLIHLQDPAKLAKERAAREELEDKILQYLDETPGANQRQIVENVQGKRDRILDALRHLVDSGDVKCTSNGIRGAFSYFSAIPDEAP
jgi:hypothetical protein